MALTDKQVKFIDEYMVDMNATAAYLRAGYKCSEAAARSSASDFLSNPNISEEIERRRRMHQEESGMTVKWILEQYKIIIDENLSKDPTIAKGALDSVGKHYGMFKDKVEHSGNVGVSIVNNIPRTKSG
jgi:phage terminase small subunit